MSYRELSVFVHKLKNTENLGNSELVQFIFKNRYFETSFCMHLMISNMIKSHCKNFEGLKSSSFQKLMVFGNFLGSTKIFQNVLPKKTRFSRLFLNATINFPQLRLNSKNMTPQFVLVFEKSHFL